MKKKDLSKFGPKLYQCQCDAMDDDRKYVCTWKHRAINNIQNSIECIENITKELLENNSFIMHHCLYHITK